MTTLSIAEANTLVPGQKIALWIPDRMWGPKGGLWHPATVEELLLDTGRLAQVRVLKGDRSTLAFLDDLKLWPGHNRVLAAEPHYWGMGVTEKEARRNLRGEGGTAKLNDVSIYKVSECVRFDHMGTMYDVVDPIYVSGPDLYGKGESKD